MSVTHESLQREIGEAHQNLMDLRYELQTLAREVAYLHPKLADDLEGLAWSMEENRKTIQNNEARKVNLDLERSRQHVGEIFTALLDRAQT